MSCQMRARVSSALAATEFHSLSPPCDHSVETPGPLIPQPGALAAGSSRYEGFRRASCRGVSVMPRMFSASYQRYSKGGDREIGRWGDGERGKAADEQVVRESKPTSKSQILIFFLRNLSAANSIRIDHRLIRSISLSVLSYPRASRHSARVRCRQVNIGVSRKVNALALVSRSSWTRSRKSDGLSVSNATTNS